MDGTGKIFRYYCTLGAFFMALDAGAAVDLFIFFIRFLRKSEDKKQSERNDQEKNFAHHTSDRA
jgi:hypothetical protein